MKYIKRIIEPVIKQRAKEYPVVMITGARQVGKTTLLLALSESLKKKMNFVSLDNISLRDLANNDPELFLEQFKTPLIIDEFQYAPNLLSYIKIRVDKARFNALKTGKSPNGLYFLTGSQSFLSMKYVSESLAGRVCPLNLHGLSTREINDDKEHVFAPEISELKTRKPKKLYTTEKLFERIFKGSFPETYNNPKIELAQYFESYIGTYIERDIRDLINVSNEVRFRRFMVALAVRTGQELNMAEIAEEVGLSAPTIQDWISILENSGLITLLQPYSNNLISRLVKRPKIYFLDTGLACHLAGYPNAKILEKSAFSGAIFETYVVSEIIKSYDNDNKNIKRHLTYYRDKRQREIDLIIEENQTLYPIEIKKTKTPKIDDVLNFEALKLLKKPIGNGIVLCMCDEVLPILASNELPSKVYSVPVQYI